MCAAGEIICNLCGVNTWAMAAQAWQLMAREKSGLRVLYFSNDTEPLATISCNDVTSVTASVCALGPPSKDSHASLEKSRRKHLLSRRRSH